MMRATVAICLVGCLLGAVAACGEDHTTTLKCSGGASGMLAAGTPVTVKGGDDLDGAAITAEAHTTIPSSAVTIGCAAADIAPAGFTPLGPAVTFGTEGTWSDRPFLLTLPYKAARLPDGAGRANVRIVAKRATGDAFFPPVSNRAIVDDDSYASRISFRAGELTTYQAVVADGAGQLESQDFAFNAIIGISMGGNAAMSIGLRHPDRFDAIADMGGEPGPSMVYTLSMVSESLFGGFCTVADQAANKGNVGTLCPKTDLRKGEYEIGADYEHMISQNGDGVGLTLSRSLYMKASRDLGRALGNPALYNRNNPYAPTGVLPSYLTNSAASRCANPTVFRDFHDREFNPDGSKPVITFCDGGQSSNGVFDPNAAQTDPAELLLAVDLNGNGKRDAGEPVVTNAYEPFSDVGTDGKADKDEPGYNAMTNPDPNGDDFHYLRNPLGTENNKTHDEGEPYEDAGLDGVMGTCQQGQIPPMGTADCYDYGEGNGKWDLSPNVERWYDSDLNVRLAALTPEQRRHMSLWFDAGIRDFLNASVSANTAVGRAMAEDQLPFAVYDGFSVMNGGTIEHDGSFDFEEIPWADLPKDGYLRYGNPDATDAEINNGDGRHVGTANQAIYRIETALAYIDKHLPDGDRDDSNDGGKIMSDLMFTSPNTGRVSPYAIFLPPGYNDPANAAKRYPVVYVLHGYGQEPADLVALSGVIANHMIASAPLETRIQKFIMVYVDGRCRPQTSGVPVPAGGDGCEGGTFYMDAPLGGTARMETNLVDLMDYVDATYRTKQRGAAQVKAD